MQFFQLPGGNTRFRLHYIKSIDPHNIYYYFQVIMLTCLRRNHYKYRLGRKHYLYNAIFLYYLDLSRSYD